jgi:hypothetical protein
MVPIVGLPPTTPFTSQVTAVSCAPVTVACNACTLPSGTFAEGGEIEMTAAGRIERENDAAFDGSASGVATIRTLAGDGGVAGAV